MLCPGCKRKITNTNDFCPHCGAFVPSASSDASKYVNYNYEGEDSGRNSMLRAVKKYTRAAQVKNDTQRSAAPRTTADYRARTEKPQPEYRKAQSGTSAQSAAGRYTAPGASRQGNNTFSQPYSGGAASPRPSAYTVQTPSTQTAAGQPAQRSPAYTAQTPSTQTAAGRQAAGGRQVKKSKSGLIGALIAIIVIVNLFGTVFKDEYDDDFFDDFTVDASVSSYPLPESEFYVNAEDIAVGNIVYDDDGNITEFNMKIGAYYDLTGETYAVPYELNGNIYARLYGTEDTVPLTYYDGCVWISEDIYYLWGLDSGEIIGKPILIEEIELYDNYTYNSYVINIGENGALLTFAEDGYTLEPNDEYNRVEEA